MGGRGQAQVHVGRPATTWRRVSISSTAPPAASLLSSVGWWAVGSFRQWGRGADCRKSALACTTLAKSYSHNPFFCALVSRARAEVPFVLVCCPHLREPSYSYGTRKALTVGLHNCNHSE
eukprot:scaffold14938_cov130-Isochrysis_galbana.AAC.10